MRSWLFFKYFFKYIFTAKTRQRLLFIAVTGLFLSSFSLLVIQSIMGGLQKGLIQRSKNIHGSYLIIFDQVTSESLEELKNLLRNENISFYSEQEVEVMLKRKNYIAPAKIHGIDLKEERPTFLKNKEFDGMVMSSGLASKIKLQYLDNFQIIVPGLSDNLFGEVPRFGTETLTDYLYLGLPEVDEFEAWTRLSMIQNLVRNKGINQIRLFGDVSNDLVEKIRSIKTSMPKRILSWEEMNRALVWSLRLETKVMLMLFISMTCLVSISITSGLMIFYSKIRRDLISFWILGMSQTQLTKLSFRFILIISTLTIFLGVTFGLAFLGLMKSYGREMMPNIFMERDVPVSVEFSYLVISLIIPFSVSFAFNLFSFKNFRKENPTFISNLRGSDF